MAAVASLTTPPAPPAKNLAELFDWRVRQQPNEVAYAFVRDDLTVETLTYEQAQERVSAIAALIRSRATSGERALLVYRAGLEVVCAFWACLRANIVPVPAPSPDTFRLRNSLPRLLSIADDASASLALTTSQIQAAAVELDLSRESLPIDRWIPTDLTEPKHDDQPTMQSTVSESAVAYLQYTSGSTSAPRGVMVGHANVIANCAAISKAYEWPEEGAHLSWSPVLFTTTVSCTASCGRSTRVFLVISCHP